LASEADHQLSCSSEVILAADTTVVVGERILGKPVDVRDAVEMLLSLSGRNHFVWTAWAVLPVNGSLGAPECGECRWTKPEATLRKEMGAGSSAQSSGRSTT